MPCKLSVGLNKKIGLPNYSSLGANCQIECEVDWAVMQEGPERFQAEAKRHFDLCRQAVEEELARETAMDAKPRAAANGHDVPLGRVASGGDYEDSRDLEASTVELEPAEIGLTERQLSFIQDLAGQIRSLGIQIVKDLPGRGRRPSCKSVCVLEKYNPCSTRSANLCPFKTTGVRL